MAIEDRLEEYWFGGQTLDPMKTTMAQSLQEQVIIHGHDVVDRNIRKGAKSTAVAIDLMLQNGFSPDSAVVKAMQSALVDQVADGKKLKKRMRKTKRVRQNTGVFSR